MKIARLKSIIRRYWYFLLVIPATALCILFLANDTPQYLSQSIISTGLPGENGKVLNMQNGVFEESGYSRSRANIPGLIRLKQVIDQVSYALIIHDLTEQEPFRKPSKLAQQLTPEAKKFALRIYRDKQNKHEALNTTDPAQKGLYMVLQSMGYDDSTLLRQIEVYRKDDNDFIYIEYPSENPALSAFVVNQLTDVFLRYYTILSKEDELSQSQYLTTMMQQRYASLNQKIDSLTRYKVQHNIIDAGAQSQILNENLRKVTAEKQQAKQQLQAYNGAIRSIDSRFNSTEQEDLKNVIKEANDALLDLKSQLNNLNRERLSGGYATGSRADYDTLQKKLAGEINQLTEKYLSESLTKKKNLVTQKITLETQRDLAQNHFQGISSQIDQINNHYQSLVPFDAQVQAFKINIDIATREYFEVMNRYIEANLAFAAPVPVRQVQAGFAGVALPSAKTKMLLYGLLGAIAFCLTVYGSLYLFDQRIMNAEDLASRTGQEVLGYLYQLPQDFTGMYNIWYTNGSSPIMNEQKKLLKSIRFEIDQLLSKSNGNNVVTITSLLPQEGKSFLAINLAYAFAMMKKEVLLIDGNFRNPVITNTLHPTQYIEDIFETGQLNFKSEGLLITVAGNRGMESSVLEVGREDTIHKFFNQLPFDVIIVETESLDTDNRAKEWFIFSSAIVSMYNAGHSLSDADEQRISFLQKTARFGGFVVNNVKSRLKAQLPFNTVKEES